MEQLNLALALFGATVLFLGLFSQVLRTHLSAEPLVALGIGVLLGPEVANLVDPATWADRSLLLEQAARLTLAVGLVEIALSFYRGEIFELRWSLLLRLGVVMPAMWGVSGLLVYWILDLPFWVAFLLGAIFTPTDPIISSALVNGEIAKRNLPEMVRDSLSAESGANDGLAFPLVMLPMLMLAPPADGVWHHWFRHTWLIEVMGAVAVGVALGWGIGKVMSWARTEEKIEAPALTLFTIALALTVLGIAKGLGSDGIIAVFVAGLVFDHQVEQGEEEDKRIQHAVNRFLMLPVFLILGAVLPMAAWWDLGGSGVALVLAILFLRRLPVVLALQPLAPMLESWRQAAVVGWFGPIGIAALYYATLAERHLQDPIYWNVATLVITASIVVHGITGTFVTRIYRESSKLTDDEA